MRRRRRGFGSFIPACLLLLLLSLVTGAAAFPRTVQAKSYTTNSGAQAVIPAAKDPEQRIFDYAELFTEDEEERLLRSIRRIEKRIRGDVVLLTTEEVPEDAYYGSETSRKFAEQFYLDNGFSEDGFIYLVDLSNRILWTAGSGRFSTDEYAELEDRIYRAALDYAKQGDYYRTAVVCLDYLDRIGNIPRALVPDLLSVAVSAAGALLGILGFVLRHRMTQPSRANTPVVKVNHYQTQLHDSRFLGKTVTRTPIPKSTGGGGSFGGGGGHSGGFSGGGSFSGGGGHF